MKRLIIIFICFMFVPTKAIASVAVMDMDSNRLLYGENEHTKKLTASTSKILTALVVINNANLSDEVTVTEEVLKSFGSGIYIEVGEVMSVEDMLYGLMMRSGNDAAIMLAFFVGGSMEGFVKLMNDLAISIGMTNSYFINSSGLENDDGDGNTSTAYDMALLMSYAMKNETFKKITGTKHRIVKTNYKTYEWYNKNKLLSMYKYTTGGKTGYTKKAYRTLVTSSSKDGKNLVVVTLDEADDFDKHINYYEETFKKYKLVNIIDSKTFLKDDDLKVLKDFSMLLNDDEIDKVKVNVNYTNDIIDRIGYLTVELDENIYFRENIYHLEQVEDQKLTLWGKLKRFFRNLFS